MAADVSEVSHERSRMMRYTDKAIGLPEGSDGIARQAAIAGMSREAWIRREADRYLLANLPDLIASAPTDDLRVAMAEVDPGLLRRAIGLG